MMLARIWIGVRDHWPGRKFEWLMGAVALGMGLALLVQPYMFELARHYRDLDSWADEGVFSDLFLMCGGFRLVALIINGTFSRFPYSPHLRAVSASMGVMMWGAFAYSFLHAFSITTGMGSDVETSLGPAIVYGGLACAEALNVRTASQDIGAGAGRSSDVARG